jgi:hypothetical protein
MSQAGGSDWQAVEIYSNFLRIRGEVLISHPLRLSDEVNRLTDYLQLRNTITEPLLSSYPVVSPMETNTTIHKSSVVMILHDGDQIGPNPMMWREKVRHQVVLNTTALSMAADVHLEPRISLLTHLERSAREFLPVTRVSAVVVASLSGQRQGTPPQTLQREFALVNPQAIVSFSVRESEGPTPSG